MKMTLGLIALITIWMNWYVCQGVNNIHIFFKTIWIEDPIHLSGYGFGHIQSIST